jgi:hypothetical protein
VENDQAPAMRAHVLADGTPLTLGMRVVDYDRKHGVIVDDRDARFPRNAVALDVPHQHRTSSGVQPIPPGWTDDRHRPERPPDDGRGGG